MAPRGDGSPFVPSAAARVSRIFALAREGDASSLMAMWPELDHAVEAV